MRGSARILDVKMAQFVLKIEKLSHIMGPRGSQDLRSPSSIMAPDNHLDFNQNNHIVNVLKVALYSILQSFGYHISINNFFLGKFLSHSTR